LSYIISLAFELVPRTSTTHPNLKMTHLDYRNGVSIAEIVVYIPALTLAIYLAVKHGIGKSSGWMYLIIICLARIIGAGMQLATINDPTNYSLYIGSSILNNVGFTPLELACLGFLSRLLDSINKTKHTVLNPGMLKLIQLIVIVGLILGIVGGVNAGDGIKATGIYHPQTLNKVGTALIVVTYVMIVAVTIVTSFSVSNAEPGEHRLFGAVAIALPFMLVRLIYSCLSTFTTIKTFNLLAGNTTVFLVMAILMEMICVIGFEIMGMTLRKQEKVQHVEATHSYNPDEPLHQGQASPSHSQNGQKVPHQDNMALRIAKKTIIGRIVMGFMPEKREDVEMQQGRQYARQ